MASTHVVAGVAAWVLLAPHLPHGVAAQPLPLAVAGLAGLLPDIDHPRSWLGRRLPFLSRPVSKLFGHRGATHSLAFAVAFAWLAIARAPHWGPPIATGYGSHLLADFLTPAGIPLLWPSRRGYAMPLCRTGSWTESLLAGAVMAWLALRLIPGLAAHTGLTGYTGIRSS